MSVMMINANVRPEHASDVEEAARAVFEALDAAKPEGVRYASYRLPGDSSYLVLLEIQDGVENLLPTIAEFRSFQEQLKGWLVEPVPPQSLTVVGEYRAF